MATTFQSMNIPMSPRDAADGPSAPVPLGSPIRAPREDQAPQPRVSFAESNGKRALPVSPQGTGFPPLSGSQDDRGSTLSAGTPPRGGRRDDIEMGSDGEEEGSDTESADGDEGRPSKKKKGQRFFCTDYPPCNLSFTRSEHLARHIRKHTGERPFQCHCARRFSRLDNLRQHAQTVHVNEDIPGDSLAATGTRFQRQIRTDRVRPQGRARASTGGSTSSHRGHGRNLSTSSIASTSSTMSTLSNLSALDASRRPPPLMMAEQSPRQRLTIDTMKASPHSSYPTYGRQSPGGDNATTPTSYSNTPSSPFNSTLGSPLSMARHGSWGDRGHNRRLSVPSSANPFQSSGVPSPGYMAGPMQTPGHSRTSSTSSIVTSPTSSIHSFARSEAAEPDWRRRTWHPSTYSGYGYQQRPATSGLAFHQTPDAPRPAFAPQPAAASPQQRLPGFETFDQISQRPATPPPPPPSQQQQQQPSEPTRQPTYPGADRRGHVSWDMSLHQNLTKLDIANGTPPREGSWRMQEPPSQPSQPLQGPPQQPPQGSPPARTHPPLASQASQETIRSPTTPFTSEGPTPQRAKRQGFYHAPFNVPHQLRPARTSSDDTSSSEGVPTPMTTSVDYQPSIVHANGYIEPQPAAASSFGSFSHSQAPPPPLNHAHPHGHPSYDATRPAGPPPPPAPDSKSHAMTGLEALVAAATSEDKARGGPR